MSIGQPNNTDARFTNSTAQVGVHAPTPAVSKKSMGFDFWGGIFRRKFIVIFFALLGVGGGYVYNQQQENEFVSTVQLMIWVQTPPKFVEGQMVQRQVSIPKHVNLITSQRVLDRVINDSSIDVGNENPDAFATRSDLDYSAKQLKSMIKVSGKSESDDTLNLKCTGSNKDDLPLLLTRVVDAYRKTLDDDTKKSSIAPLGLVNERIDRLNEELKGDPKKGTRGLEDKYIELVGNLDFFELKGVIMNSAVRNRDAQQLVVNRKLEEKNLLASKIGRFNAAMELKDEKLFKVAVHDAKTYLQLTNYKQLDVKRQHGTNLDRLNKFLERSKERERFAVEQLDALNFELSKLSKLGSGHPKYKELIRQIEHQRKQVSDFQQEVIKLQKQAEAANVAADSEFSWEALIRREEEELLSLYAVRLDFDMTSIDISRKAAEKQLEQLKETVRVQASAFAKANVLKRRIEEKNQALVMELERKKNLDDLANFDVFHVEVLSPPTSAVKVSPILAKSLAIFGLIGAFLGIGLALLVDRSELVFRAPEEIAERLNVSVIGQIPKINLKYKKNARYTPVAETNAAANLAALLIPYSIESEAFRAIRTQLFFAANSDDTKVIMITSPSPNDGKSTVSGNLAGSIAQTGKKVVLVDGDFRRPRVHQYFDVEMNPGIIDMMEGSNKLEDIVRPSFQENLYLVTCGGRPKNPGEIVTSEAFHDMIAVLREEFDFVLIDSPPALPVADPIVMSTCSDGVYLVLRIRKGVITTAAKAKESLDRVHANILGVIVNGMDENPHYNEYGGQYNSAYSYSGYNSYHESQVDSPRRITQASDRAE